ncbi:Uncharacterized protein APZ42_009631, partial [Daphnia magna]
SGRGRKSKLSDRDKLYICNISKTDRRKTAGVIAQEFNITRKITVRKTTVRRALKECNMNGRVGAKKPLLRKINMDKRLAFAKEH